MSEYLDQLIKTLEAEAIEERAELDRNRAKSPRETRHATSRLKRTLQRLEILKSLSAAEARKPSAGKQTSHKSGRKRQRHEQSAGARV
jgi:hypothetical protein